MASSAPNTQPRAIDIALDQDELTVALAWFPRLLHASSEQRRNWRLIGDGHGIHWPDVDEDLSVEGLLTGASAPDAMRRAV